jgi:hypothetical protein
LLHRPVEHCTTTLHVGLKSAPYSQVRPSVAQGAPTVGCASRHPGEVDAWTKPTSPDDEPPDDDVPDDEPPEVAVFPPQAPNAIVAIEVSAKSPRA